MNDLDDANNDYIKPIKKLGMNVEKEKGKVSFTNTDSEKRTVMVVPLDTHITVFTVNRSGRSYYIASSTILDHSKMSIYEAYIDL